MVPEINIWAVLLATLSSMLVGALWYSRPVFGRRWMELARVDESRIQSSAVGAYIVTIFASFLTAAVLAGSVAIAQEFYGGSFFLNSLITGLILWLGFTAARFLTHYAFERRPVALTAMNLGYELVTILVMAAIIGAFGG